jgi:NTE family protein
MSSTDRRPTLQDPRPIQANLRYQTLSLALQGGGSFGAFTWGVLDRLLEERSVRFDIVSGASGGAVNAVLLASGLLAGGREAARKRLESFWRRISGSAGFLPVNAIHASSAAFGNFDLMTRIFAPYQFNPFDLNPLREALAVEVDFERVARGTTLRLMIAATRVSDGQSRIFRDAEITIDAVLASACLPLLHRAIEIDGDAYWDGGYSGNPPLIPIAQETCASEILIVRVTPRRTDKMPVNAQDIARRLDQIAFNNTLNVEIEALRLGAELGLSRKLRDLQITHIAAEDTILDLADQSAANLGWTFLSGLRDKGRAAANDWLAARPQRSWAKADAERAGSAPSSQDVLPADSSSRSLLPDSPFGGDS